MNFKELVTSRYSRSFASVPCSGKIAAVLEAAPGTDSCNLQPQRIFVLQSRGLTKVRACQRHFDAPVVLLVCYDKAESWERGFDGLTRRDGPHCWHASDAGGNGAGSRRTGLLL